MTSLRLNILATALCAAAVLSGLGVHTAFAQPAKGAGPAFERVREVMSGQFDDMKLTGDPDRDFAAVLIAHHEDLIFLAKTQLEHGGDRQLRLLAQAILDEQQRQISTLKEWQVRSRQADYKAQPDQAPPGSGPLDRQAQGTTQTARTPPAAQSPANASPAASAPTPPAASLPLVSGTVESIDAAQGKLTIDHGPIPNLNMDAMTMVFRARDAAMLKQVKKGDKVQFQADRVNGQMTVTSIKKGR